MVIGKHRQIIQHLLPVDIGANWVDTVQVSPGINGAAQVVAVFMKSAVSPAEVTVKVVNAAVPSLLSVVVSGEAAVVPTTWSPKS